MGGNVSSLLVLSDLLGDRRPASRLGVPVRVLAYIADIERLNRFGCVSGRLFDCWSYALHSAMAAGNRTSKYSSMAFCCSVLLATVSVFMVQLCCTGLIDIEIGRGR